MIPEHPNFPIATLHSSRHRHSLEDDMFRGSLLRSVVWLISLLHSLFAVISSSLALPLHPFYSLSLVSHHFSSPDRCMFVYIEYLPMDQLSVSEGALRLYGANDVSVLLANLIQAIRHHIYSDYP